ncbi:serine/threonine-protein phosphatase 2A activator 1 [Coniella lustricola]|uniref:Serine/threonine-protein phosphatase 2A activator n=1 Tax=Coniella lustricola TaxID=2025994 RepID=A0A2T3AGS6_9PEZI|nr:serine/threonine-protein phosphatase 2A activator 1 [Coniella lustricola]
MATATEPFQPTSSSGSLSSAQFPQLEILDSSIPHAFLLPNKFINDGPDVSRFLVSQAYRDIGIFLMQLNRSLCPRKTSSGSGTGPSKVFPLNSADRQDPESVQRLHSLLGEIMTLIDAAPPDPGPRRFGNVSFRKWYNLLEQNVETLLKQHVSADVLGFPAPDVPDGENSRVGAIDELRSYLLGAFGSPQRLDYGTGHELSFFAFLGCLWKLGAFKDGAQGGDIERSIVLGVFEPYLKVIRKLILTYTLEPAGSHGVWGLDDHSFMPYIFGSAQFTRPITENDTMPLEGSVERAPRPGDITKSDAVERLREINMYFSAIGFINDVKKGPFWEHSPILYDISGIKDGWGKINKGMIKMFNAEVLSKFPVVQHFPFGSLFSWDVDPNAAAPQQSVHMANQPLTTTAASAASLAGSTTAPWAQTARAGGLGRPNVRLAETVDAQPAGLVSLDAVRPSGPRGTSGAQISITKAPWTK